MTVEGPPLNDCDWLLLYIEALYELDARGRLSSTGGSDGADRPRFVLGRTAHGNVWRVGADEPPAQLQRLSRLAAREAPLPTDTDMPPPPPERFSALRDCLVETRAISSEWTGPVYRFSDRPAAIDQLALLSEGIHLIEPGDRDGRVELLRAAFPTIDSRAAALGPVAAAIEQDEMRSVCFTAAGEVGAGLLAYVLTQPGHRGNGLAGRCVARFALAVMEKGGAPLYATDWADHAGLAVARKLGLEFCGELLCWS